jgi:hypothetical protein
MISIVWNIGILDIGCGIWKMEYGMWVVSGCSMLYVVGMRNVMRIMSAVCCLLCDGWHFVL